MSFERDSLVARRAREECEGALHPLTNVDILDAASAIAIRVGAKRVDEQRNALRGLLGRGEQRLRR